MIDYISTKISYVILNSINSIKYDPNSTSHKKGLKNIPWRSSHIIQLITDKILYCWNQICCNTKNLPMNSLYSKSWSSLLCCLHDNTTNHSNFKASANNNIIYNFQSDQLFNFHFSKKFKSIGIIKINFSTFDNLMNNKIHPYLFKHSTSILTCLNLSKQNIIFIFFYLSIRSI